jgi:hypothetical protein
MAAPNAEGGAREIARVEFTMPLLPVNCNPLAIHRTGVGGGRPADSSVSGDGWSGGDRAPQACHYGGFAR